MELESWIRRNGLSHVLAPPGEESEATLTNLFVYHVQNIAWIAVQPEACDMTDADFDAFESVYEQWVYGPYVRRLQHLAIVFDLSDVRVSSLLTRPHLIVRMTNLLKRLQPLSRYFLVRSAILFGNDDGAMRLLQPFMDSDELGTRLFTSNAEAAMQWCRAALDEVGNARVQLLAGREGTRIGDFPNIVMEPAQAAPTIAPEDSGAKAGMQAS